jgi:hypothetical protein
MINIVAKIKRMLYNQRVSLILKGRILINFCLILLNLIHILIIPLHQYQDHNKN